MGLKFFGGKILYEKPVHKTLMKLTPDDHVTEKLTKVGQEKAWPMYHGLSHQKSKCWEKKKVFKKSRENLKVDESLSWENEFTQEILNEKKVN